MAEIEDVEVHLATCAECAGELARYREVTAAIGLLRDALEEPTPGFQARTVAAVLGGERRLTWSVRRLVRDERIHVAAASLGGALVGAGAIALLWWRAAHRAISPRPAQAR